MEIENRELTLEAIPPSGSDWNTIIEFALTFDGYKTWGSNKKCAEIANAHKDGTLTELRTCLFFEYRRWRHFGEEPDEKAMTYIRGVVEKIRDKVATGSLD